jgi:hypothetical protein
VQARLKVINVNVEIQKIHCSTKCNVPARGSTCPGLPA